ncbi:hypothetical protein M885DRAFT_541065 [Pelagophyceae sp. CCMP2097]|nr:hypothetical protein M885DRAFT_541065 [Pelagophyceae sp. CCMP2097]|mmetsp:Transcript_16565/g.55962  ORF Transcript_16565/g.55962 Transcript_16565/m.55962 type:complete len:310 (+) Transcript_16565:71-1000(+)
MLRLLQQVIFGATLIGGLFVVCFAELLARPCSFVSLSRRQMFVKRQLSRAFAWTVTVCFWIRVKTTARSKPAFTAARLELAEGRSLGFLVTHASYLDAILIYKLFPGDFVARSKTIASGALRKLPLLGAICEGCGHIFLGYRASKDPASFGLEEASREKVRLVVEDHMHKNDGHSNGVLFMAPEGMVNPNPSVLMPFRTGGMRIALDNDIELWAAVFVGNEVSWPKLAAIGGYPGDIALDFQPIFSDSAFYKARAILARAQKEVAAGTRKAVASTHNDDHDAALLAEVCRERMQQLYDDLSTDMKVLFN